MSRFDFTYSIWWNVLLLTGGSLLFVVGLNGLAVPHRLITGGLFGTAMLLHYVAPFMSIGLMYGLFNIPLFVLGWWKVSKRFFFYSLYAMVALALMAETIHPVIEVKNQLYAAIAAGIICGAGSGLILRSLGSAGGLDILAVYLFQRYNIGLGRFYFMFNGVLFLFSALVLNLDLIIASLVMVFISSAVMEYCLSMFSQRKMVFIISCKSDVIARQIMKKLRIGSTFLQGKGAYSGQPRDVLMTVINNIQLKRLEEIVFSEDPQALFVVENTFNVIGSSFSRRKLY